MRRPTGIVAVLALVLVGCDPPPSPTPTGPFSKIIAFGDSYSDTGNLIAELGIVPGPPYFQGRFSNGPLWIEGLAAHYGLPIDPALHGGTNYAHGAASSEIGLTPSDNFAAGLNFLQQIQLYIDQPDGSELFVVMNGSVDVLLNLRGECSTTADHTADNLMSGIQNLYNRGARYFLVGNLPDLGLSPQFRTGPQAAAASSACAAINDALSSRLDQLATLDGIHIYRLDAAGLLADLFNNPPPSITNTTNPAWTGGYTGFLAPGLLAPNADAYLYFDGVHPTHYWHDQLADRAITLLDSQSPTPPPPSTQPQPFQLPPSVRYWAMYFTLEALPRAPPGECRY